MLAEFKNDGNVKIILPECNISKVFAARDNHEVLFRQICHYMIKSSLIDKNIIDLGAWIGDNAIPWAKNITGLVYAIDPSPENCKYIRDVAGLNNLKNVTVIEKAISNKSEILSTKGDISHCSFVYTDCDDGGGKKEILATSLDILFFKRRNNRCKFYTFGR